MAVVAQADNAPFAIDFLAETDRTIPLVLLAPPVFSGVETFLLEQVGLAEGQGYGAEELRALEGYIREIADVVLGDGNPYMREYRLEALRSRSPVELPLNAAFPADERQTYFFASPLWHDRLAFQPEEALGPVRAPLLVLIGTEDPNTPMEAYLAALDRGLGASMTSDATICRVPGRTRHVFSRVTVSVISEWLSARIEPPAGSARPAGDARAAAPDGCLSDEEP
jgi:pimeloyl-ACP methyl ester carboxylesterase